MKQILFFLLFCLFSINSQANHIPYYIGSATITDPHTHNIAHKSLTNANIALFVGVMALTVATFSVVKNIKFSKNNINKIQIVRF